MCYIVYFKECPVNCANGTCNQTTGNCTNGCELGYYGIDCKQSQSVS